MEVYMHYAWMLIPAAGDATIVLTCEYAYSYSHMSGSHPAALVHGG
jgi:hypothetical protein